MHVATAVLVPKIEIPRSLVDPRDRAAYREAFLATFRELAEATAPAGLLRVPPEGVCLPRR